MAVIPVKKYKTIKDEKGNKVQVPKSSYEWNKETKNGTAIWYFTDRYKLNDKIKQYRSAQFTSKHEAKDEERLFLTNPIEYIKIHSKKASANIINNDLQNDKDNKNLNKYFEEFIIYYSQYVKSGTIYCYKIKYKCHLKELIGDITPYNLSFDFIKRVHEIINRKNLTTKTKNTIHSTLVEFLEYLKKQGLIEQNYAFSYGSFKEKKNIIKEKEDIRFQTIEEFNLFIEVVDDEFWNLFFRFGFWHGPRKGEQRALFVEDINLEDELVDFNKTFTRDENGHEVLGNIKNGKSGKIYLYQECQNDLKNHIKKMMALPGYNSKWFLFGGPIKLSRNIIDRKLEIYYNKLKEKYPNKKINELTYHEFARHSHATYLYTIGKDNPNIVNIIAERLRDTPEVIRKVYVHNDEVISNQTVKELLIERI